MKLLLRSAILLLSASAASILPTAHSAAQAQPSLHILDQWKLSEAGSWGHLNFDAKSNRLYVPRTGYVAVLDATSGTEIGKVNGFVDARAEGPQEQQVEDFDGLVVIPHEYTLRVIDTYVDCR